jgi:hypothetical protein
MTASIITPQHTQTEIIDNSVTSIAFDGHGRTCMDVWRGVGLQSSYLPDGTIRCDITPSEAA